uniref:Uncharacterized protein n=1 Tax=Meloidogyne incognita TaxID=6306 RepID=A0A914MC18_MELIC
MVRIFKQLHGSINMEVFLFLGADLKERCQMTEFEVFQFVDFLRRTYNEISALPLPVLAAIDGCGLGGGLKLVMAWDIPIACNFAPIKTWGGRDKLAIIPGSGGTQRLPGIVGLAKAKELIFIGKVLTGSEALSIVLGVTNGQNSIRSRIRIRIS